MKSAKTLGVAVSFAALAVASAPAAEMGRTAQTAEWASGTWQLAARTIHQQSPYANPLEIGPNGMKIMHADGRFSILIKRPHRERDPAIRLVGRGQNGSGLLADMAYGTWSLDEEAKTVTFRFEMSTFPTWGREETRVYSLREGHWSYVDPSAKDSDDNIYLDWKRLD